MILAEHDCADVVGGDFVVAEVDVSVVEVGADAEQLEELTRLSGRRSSRLMSSQLFPAPAERLHRERAG